MKAGMNLLLWTTEVGPQHYKLLEDLKRWGCDGVELPIFNMDTAKLAEVGRTLDSLGLERTAVTVATPGENPISPDAAVRRAALDRLKRAIEASKAAGATVLCGPYHSALGEFTGRGPTADEWKWAADVLRQAAGVAHEAGVTLALEYLNRFECYFLNCAADTVRFVGQVNHPALRMMYDTFHANIEEKGIAEAIRTAAPVCVHVHISENDRSTPGEGHVDWKTTFATLKQVGYDGWLMIEAFGLALADLAAATKIWRRMYPSEEHLVRRGLEFIHHSWSS